MVKICINTRMYAYQNSPCSHPCSLGRHDVESLASRVAADYSCSDSDYFSVPCPCWQHDYHAWPVHQLHSMAICARHFEAFLNASLKCDTMCLNMER